MSCGASASGGSSLRLRRIGVPRLIGPGIRLRRRWILAFGASRARFALGLLSEDGLAHIHSRDREDARAARLRFRLLRVSVAVEPGARGDRTVPHVLIALAMPPDGKEEQCETRE